MKLNNKYKYMIIIIINKFNFNQNIIYKMNYNKELKNKIIILILK